MLHHDQDWISKSRCAKVGSVFWDTHAPTALIGFATSATTLILAPILMQKMETATLASDHTLFAALPITIFAISFTVIFTESVYRSPAVVNDISDLRLSPAPAIHNDGKTAEINKNANIQIVNHNYSVPLPDLMA